jgi:hypothetical protein
MCIRDRTGTTNFLPKWTSSSAIGDSVIQENSGSIGINGAAVPDSGDTRIQINATTFASLNLKSTNVNSLIRSHNTNGGFYLGTISNHFVSFFSNDTERMRINSAGNVGIGTTSPNDRFHVVGGISSTGIANIINEAIGSIQVGYDGTNGIIRTWNSSPLLFSVFGHYQFNTNGSERMRIAANGNVGIGTASITSFYGFTRTLSVENSDNAEIQIRCTGATNALVSLGTASSGSFLQSATQQLFFRVNGLYTASITTTGNFLIGTLTDNGERLYVSGNIRATGTITANSDITLKKNLLKIENALEKVEQINGYTYEFKADDSKRHAGVIAQEIEGVLPEIVNKGNDGILGVEYGNISALLIEAIKDLKKDNESLRAIVEGLRK